LKQRQPGQGTHDEVARKDLKADLEDRERKARGEKKSIEQASPPPPPPDDDDAMEVAIDDQHDYAKDDADDEEFARSSDDDDDDDDDDDEALLLAELERIKKERAEEAARKAAEEAAIKEKERQEQIIRGNPLLDLVGEDHTVKRRWDDDVVFKNTCKGEPLKKKRFINDTVRNDFHKKFLQKYIK